MEVFSKLEISKEQAKTLSLIFSSTKKKNFFLIRQHMDKKYLIIKPFKKFIPLILYVRKECSLVRNKELVRFVL
jgi:hypothetical protein